MRLRGLILLVAIYVTLDLANPFMPGAFEFDADRSVEATRRQPADPGMRPALPETEAPATSTSPRQVRPERPVGPPPAVAWLSDLRARHGGPADPPSPSDDH